jgi:hypothetical protein
MTSPFVFLRREKNVELLAKRLRRLGVELDFQESDSTYIPEKVGLSCPWISSLAIVFRRKWWPDGINQEDSQIFLSVNGTEILALDLAQLLRGKLVQPLPDLTAEKLTEAVERAIQGAQTQKTT